MLVLAREAGGGDEAMRGGAKDGQFEKWLPVVDTFRTLVRCEHSNLPDTALLYVAGLTTAAC
jgi:hypothetical protein